MKKFIELGKYLKNKIAEERRERDQQSYSEKATSQRGAVSIFLVICLLPTLFMSFFFLDVTRFSLARGLVSTAEDLALESILAGYDGSLLDFYGLTALKDESIYSSAETNFKSNLSTIGGGGGGGFLPISGSEGAGSLLQMTVPEFETRHIENSDLGNDAVLRTQIVDFMKYRAPMNAVSSLFSRLKNAGSTLRYAPGDAQISDREMVTFEAMNDLIEKAMEIRDKIVEYEQLGFSDIYINDLLDRLGDGDEVVDQTYRGLYKHLHIQAAIYWEDGNHGSNPRDVRNEAYALTTLTDQWILPAVNAIEIKNALGEGPFSVESVVAAGWAVIRLGARVKEYNDQLATKYADEKYKIPEEEEVKGRWAETIYYEMFKPTVESGDKYKFESRLKPYEEAYVTYKHMYDNMETPEDPNVEYEIEDIPFLSGIFTLPTSGVMTLAAINNMIEQKIQTATYEKIKDGMDVDDFPFKKYYTEMAKIFNTNPMNSSEEELVIDMIYDELNLFNEKVDDAVPLLKDIRDGINDLEGLVEKYNNARAEWESSVNTHEGNDSATPDLIADHRAKLDADPLDPTLDKLLKIEEPVVKALAKRADNVRLFLIDMKDQMNSVRYGNPNPGRRLKDIDSVDTFLDTIDMPIVGKDNQHYLNYLAVYGQIIDQFEGAYFRITDEPIVKLENLTSATDSNSPNLATPQNNLYDFIKSLNDSSITEKEDEAEGLIDKLKDLLDAVTTVFEPNESYEHDFLVGQIQGQLLSAASSLTEPEDTKDLNNASEQTANFSQMEDLGPGDNIRDAFFITDYIMKMFTHDTTRQEAYVKDNGTTELSAAMLLQTQEGGQMFNSTRDVVNYWRNLTLRNQFHTNEVHWSLGNEIEYILFGGPNITNKALSYGTIFAMRIAMNLFPVFNYVNGNNQLAWSVKATETALSAIPIFRFLFRALVILVLTVVESALDVMYLKAGLPNMFFKGLDTKTAPNNLYISGANILNENSGEVTSDINFNVGEISDATELRRDTSGSMLENKDGGKNDPPEGINDWYYSTYMGLFLISRLAFNVLGTAENTILRTGDVMQQNLNYTEGGGYDFTKMYTYFEVSGKAEIKGMFNYSAAGATNLNPLSISFKQVKGY